MILHNVKYFTSVAMSLKEQKKLLSETVNAIFRFVISCVFKCFIKKKYCRKNAIRGRQLEPPMDYKEAMEMVSTVMQKNGHSHLSNLCGVDPYLTKNSRTEEIRLLKEKVSQSVILK